VLPVFGDEYVKREAKQQSRDSVYVVFDKSGMLQCAIPDTFKGK